MLGGEAFDGGTEVAEFLVDVFVTAIEVIDSVNDGSALCGEASDNEGGASTEIGGHDGRTVEPFDAVDDGTGAFDGNAGSHAFEFWDVHEAAGVDAFGDDA